MIPKHDEWKTWSAMERVTYVAQLAAALALLPTVAFSWLSLREARLAREDQAKYFRAEKVPLIELQSVAIRDSLLIGTVRNAGESRARSLRFWYSVTNPPKPCDVTVSVDERDTNVSVIERGQTAEFIIASATDFENCGIKTKSFKLRPSAPYSNTKSPPYLEILLIWLDVAGQEVTKKYEVEFLP